MTLLLLKSCYRVVRDNYFNLVNSPFYYVYIHRMWIAVRVNRLGKIKIP